MTTIIHTPKNTFRIGSIWAAVSVDDDTGMEGICVVVINGVSIPLLAADQTRLEWITTQAEILSRITGKRVKLIKLTSRIEVKEFSPFGGTA